MSLTCLRYQGAFKVLRVAYKHLKYRVGVVAFLQNLNLLLALVEPASMQHSETQIVYYKLRTFVPQLINYIIDDASWSSSSK
jgi:hypothetical protein